MIIYCFCGPVCSGKSTLAKTLGLGELISIGDFVRSMFKGIPHEKLCPGPEYLCIYEDEIRGYVLDCIESCRLDGMDISLDGFPRTVEQLEFLTRILSYEDKLVFFVLGIDTEMAKGRMKDRKRDSDNPDRLKASERHTKELREAIGRLGLNQYNITLLV